MNVWPTGVVQWPCQVGWLALTTKIRNCRGFYMQTFSEKQNPEAKSHNIRLLFGAISFWTHPLFNMLFITLNIFVNSDAFHMFCVFLLNPQWNTTLFDYNYNIFDLFNPLWPSELDSLSANVEAVFISDILQFLLNHPFLNLLFSLNPSDPVAMSLYPQCLARHWIILHLLSGLARPSLWERCSL